MRNAINERELKDLEAELRKLGTPYDAPEPDARYWANFRVRVMERIEEEEARSAQHWPSKVLAWIEEHVLVTSLSTAGVLVAIWAALMLQPVSTQIVGPSASQPMASAEIAQPSVTKQIDPIVQNSATSPESKPSQTSSATVRERHRFAAPVTRKPAIAIPDMAADIPATSATDAIGPVSLEDLSTTELRSVLDNLKQE